MDIFKHAGVELSKSEGFNRIAPVARRVQLFNRKVVADALANTIFDPSAGERQAAIDYAKTITTPAFSASKEEAARPHFIDEILKKVLGYRDFVPDGTPTLRHEQRAGSGEVDVALGHFYAEQKPAILAPFELKGPTTKALDAIMPGRKISPVMQAWHYASALAGVRFVLLSNCVEIRLYRYGRGMDAYEHFDLTRLGEEPEHKRLWLMLSAKRFLAGKTDELLAASDNKTADITNKLYLSYKELRTQLIDFLTHSVDGPKLASLAAIESAQKILDRILFIAFAQGYGLLPDGLLARATKAHNEFNPVPLWQNFTAIFHRVDKGHHDSDIPPYNGGLFAHDPLVDAITIPDPLATDLASLGRWDYKSELPVLVLGHIFEQSITDIETLKAEAVGAQVLDVGKRKREGVVYTPDSVTRFLVAHTLEKTLKERFDALWQDCGLGTDGDNDPAQELPFWQAWTARLRHFTIVDPACGSGAFLVAAYDVLYRRYDEAIKRLMDLGAPVDFDFVDEIVTKNLYGVDLNAESVEITRLALWLKTARRDHRLQYLDQTIEVGNSLIDDPAFTPRPFAWQAAFPDVFDHGGFDVVLGNPPYVRMEFLSAIKPYLQQHYQVAADRTDLYAYFFERGVGLLKAGGRLGFISSSTFFRTGSGEKLRAFLSGETCLETIIDFGDAQIFEGVTTYPATLTLRKAKGAPDDNVHYWKMASSDKNIADKNTVPDDLAKAFEAAAQPMPRLRLGAGAWRLENDALAALRMKIVRGRKTLGEIYGAPMRGIVTGLNKAFIIDRATRDRLVKADKTSADVLRPMLHGENVKRWRVESEDFWLINIPFGFTHAKFAAVLKEGADEAVAWGEMRRHYPAIAAHLAGFEARARVRTDQGQFWWEQRACAYMDKFDQPKIVYPEISQGAKFALETKKYIHNKTIFMITNFDESLLALLNSKLVWFYLCGVGSALRGGIWRILLQSIYIETIPIPAIPTKARETLAALATACTQKAHQRFQIEHTTRARLLDLATGDKTKFSKKLTQFWTLDFKTLQAEIKKCFGATIPVKERGQWQAFLSDASQTIMTLTEDIAALEANINQEVYALFDLTPAEIALLEASL